MKDFYVNRYSVRGDKIKKYLNSREDCFFISVTRDLLWFKIPSNLHISFSRKGKLKVKEI